MDNKTELTLEDRVLTITENGGEFEINLTQTQAVLMGLFLENPNRVFSKTELYQAYSGEGYLSKGHKHSIERHIKDIRKKLKPTSRRIVPVRGHGYRLADEFSLSSLVSLDFGELHIYPEARRVFVGDKEVHLTPSGYKILEHLAQNSNRVFSRSELYEVYSGSGFVPQNLHSVKELISFIRQKLGTAADCIKTRYGFGYVLISGDPALPSSESLDFGELHIYPEAYQVFVGDKEVLFTPSEYKVLEHLAQNSNRVFSRSELYEVYSGSGFVPQNLHSVKELISFIRQKLGTAADCIKTRYGFGYVLISGDPALPSSESLNFGELHIYPEARRVFVGERDVNLTHTEYYILLSLAEHQFWTFSKQQLYQAFKDPSSDTYFEEGHEHTVEIHVQHIRNKLEGASGLIETVRGMGYRFNPSGKPDV